MIEITTIINVTIAVVAADLIIIGLRYLYDKVEKCFN